MNGNTTEQALEERRGYTFLHLSDIHFGQEKGGQIFINQEIKRDLVAYLKDLAAVRKEASRPPFDAIIVTGDIAFSGKEAQYRDAAEWLADIAEAIGIEKTAVHVVPGNHDIDRSKISPGVHDMIDKIIGNGQAALDTYMADEYDRERLYSRFTEYRIFAAGYGCVLDREGGAAGTKDFPLANGLHLRFIGMNSALVCRGGKEDEEPGKLFLGDKQKAIGREEGVEQVILMHHPISWLADGQGVWTYWKNRARVFISGHEHKPSLDVQEIEGNGKVLKIDSGAIVPPKGEEGYGYTFNIIDVALGDNDDELEVRVEGHVWDRETTFFKPDSERFEGSHEHCAILPCPRFTQGLAKVGDQAASTGPPAPAKSEAELTSQPLPAASEGANFAELRLRYFHGLTALQRLEVLVELKVLPADWAGTTTPGFELSALEAIAGMGRTKELAQAIEKFGGGVSNGP